MEHVVMITDYFKPGRLRPGLPPMQTLDPVSCPTHQKEGPEMRPFVPYIDLRVAIDRQKETYLDCSYTLLRVLSHKQDYTKHI